MAGRVRKQLFVGVLAVTSISVRRGREEQEKRTGEEGSGNYRTKVLLNKREGCALFNSVEGAR